MNNFIFCNPDKVYFGNNQIDKLPAELKKYGSKVLLVYGGGSIKKNGLYDTVTKLMKENRIEWVELSGVEPNPRHSTVNKGAAICKKENIDVILAVGGGSTIDCSKGVAATAVSATDDVWNLVKKGEMIESGLPIVSILTNAATGSEMDMWAVISNMVPMRSLLSAVREFFQRLLLKIQKILFHFRPIRLPVEVLISLITY